MQKIMQSDAAVFRTQESLDQGVARLGETMTISPPLGAKGLT
jgi:succinate dehydrogenase/fumarate reductase flavoprotein subunit